MKRRLSRGERRPCLSPGHLATGGILSTVTLESLLSFLPAVGRIQCADHPKNKVLALAIISQNSTSKPAFGGIFSMTPTWGTAYARTSWTLHLTWRKFW